MNNEELFHTPDFLGDQITGFEKYYVWFGLAMVYLKNGQMEETLEAIQKSLEIDPTFEKAHELKEKIESNRK